MSAEILRLRVVTEINTTRTEGDNPTSRDDNVLTGGNQFIVIITGSHGPLRMKEGDMVIKSDGHPGALEVHPRELIERDKRLQPYDPDKEVQVLPFQHLDNMRCVFFTGKNLEEVLEIIGDVGKLSNARKQYDLYIPFCDEWGKFRTGDVIVGRQNQFCLIRSGRVLPFPYRTSRTK